MGKPDVMGLHEIAQRLGIGKSYARQLAEKRGFPEPTRLNAGLIWSTEDVEAWIAKYRPQLAETDSDAG